MHYKLNQTWSQRGMLSPGLSKIIPSWLKDVADVLALDVVWVGQMWTKPISFLVWRKKVLSAL